MSRPRAKAADPEAPKPAVKPRPRARGVRRTSVLTGGAGGTTVVALSRLLRPPFDQIFFYLSPFIAALIAEAWPAVVDSAKDISRDLKSWWNNRAALREMRAFVARREAQLGAMPEDDPLRARVVEEIAKGKNAIMDLELAPVVKHFAPEAAGPEAPPATA